MNTNIFDFIANHNGRFTQMSDIVVAIFSDSPTATRCADELRRLEESRLPTPGGAVKLEYEVENNWLWIFTVESKAPVTRPIHITHDGKARHSAKGGWFQARNSVLSAGTHLP